MAQDTRYTLRQLVKSPGFTITAVLTLALGIGANVAVFSVMNAILLNPTGVPHPEGVVAVRAKYQMAALGSIHLSPPDFADTLAGKDIFTSAAVLNTSDFNYSGPGAEPERLVGAKVSWQWFDVFWARPYLGRVFVRKKISRNQITKWFCRMLRGSAVSAAMPASSAERFSSISIPTRSSE